MRFDLGLLFSLCAGFERGADLDLQVLDHVHHFLALLGDEVSGLGLQARDLGLGIGERGVGGGGNGGREAIESFKLVIGKGLQTTGKCVGPIVDGVDEGSTGVPEPRESLLSLLFDSV